MFPQIVAVPAVRSMSVSGCSRRCWAWGQLTCAACLPAVSMRFSKVKERAWVQAVYHACHSLGLAVILQRPCCIPYHTRDGWARSLGGGGGGGEKTGGGGGGESTVEPRSKDHPKELVGVLSPVNHRGLHQGQTQTILLC